MLRVRQLSCARGPRVLFRELSFEASPGDLVQITGPNGSGKTTLLRTLAGLARAESGTLEWTGPAALMHSRAYIGHAAGWKDVLSVSKNLELAWQLDAEAAPREAGAIAAALERVGLSRQRNLSVARLSQGQRKRLHLARLTRSTRKLWLLDEPASSLDDAGQALLSEVVVAHLAGGGIAVIATHQPMGIAAARSCRVELGRNESAMSDAR
ncbi:MAG: cytochrome c biogenesis heme-transporting ATPase CcmA [Casimicrobiaceae bacterium]